MYVRVCCMCVHVECMTSHLLTGGCDIVEEMFNKGELQGMLRKQ